MTQEQKQFIIKALQSGIPAIAQEHIDALEEVTQIADAPQEELDGAERFNVLNQELYNVTIKVLRASFPFMANELIIAFNTAVDVCNVKFAENIRAREAKEKADAEHTQGKDQPAPDTDKMSA